MILYILLIVVSLVLGFGVQGYVKRQISKYSRVPSATGLTGAQIANQMLNSYGINNVAIGQGGSNVDHFDPRNNSITLDPDAYGKTSVSAIATACHEAGHACQFAQGYGPMKIRSLLVPVVNFTQQSWMIIFLIGLFLASAGMMLYSQWMINLAIVFYAFAVVFQLVTLPVEFNASRRGLRYMEEIGIFEGEREGAWKVLRACALTYVAAALISILNLLYLLQYRE